MKKSIITLFCLAVLAFFTACGGSDSPKVVTQKFLSAISEKKFDEAKKYATAETGAFLDKISDMMAKDPEMADSKKKPEFEANEEKIEGDAATVTFKQKGKTKDQIMKLKKVDGKWLVAISKDM